MSDFSCEMCYGFNHTLLPLSYYFFWLAADFHANTNSAPLYAVLTAVFLPIHFSLSTVFSIQLHAQKIETTEKDPLNLFFFIVATVLPGKSRPSHLLHLLVLSLMPLDDA